MAIGEICGHRVSFPPRQGLCFARIFITVVVLLCLAAPAQADFMEGWRAYQRGDFAAALNQWTKLAEKGDPVAQYNVGVMYDEGTGIKRDAGKVVNWWQKAADQGHSGAQHNLALLYIERGGEEDFVNAASLLERASANGFVFSQYSLAKLFSTGLGVSKDNTRALDLFLKAGNAGFVKAQYNLGKIYRDGIGVKADPVVSVDWFRKAAELGYAKAQEKLATRFASGSGVRSDVVEALKWAILAIQQGRTSPQKTLNDLRKIMSSQQIAEAESRAKAFRPVPAIH
jgi:TPR repeat protein